MNCMHDMRAVHAVQESDDDAKGYIIITYNIYAFLFYDTEEEKIRQTLLLLLGVFLNLLDSPPLVSGSKNPFPS